MDVFCCSPKEIYYFSVSQKNKNKKRIKKIQDSFFQSIPEDIRELGPDSGGPIPPT